MFPVWGPWRSPIHHGVSGHQWSAVLAMSRHAGLDVSNGALARG